MPIATNIERLSPGPAPTVPPWHRLTTRELVDWLGVTLQSAYNWQARRSGPPRTMTRGRRAGYRLADVQFWMEGEASPSAGERIRAFLAAHERPAAFGTLDMPPEVGDRSRKALVRLPHLSAAELDELCAALDRARVFGPKPRAAGVIGTGEVAAHG